MVWCYSASVACLWGKSKPGALAGREILMNKKTRGGDLEGLSCMVGMVLSTNGSSPRPKVKTSDSTVIFVAHEWFHCEHLEGMCKVSAVVKRSHGSKVCALPFRVMLKTSASEVERGYSSKWYSCLSGIFLSEGNLNQYEEHEPKTELLQQPLIWSPTTSALTSPKWWILQVFFYGKGPFCSFCTALVSYFP